MKSILILIFLFFPLFVHAYPSVKHDFVFYDVYPNANNNLKKAINESTPIIKNGKKYHGRTNWHVKWNFKWKRRNGRCRVVSASTSLDVKYTMPRIPNDYKVASSIRYSFGKYYELLFEHEKGHKKTGLLAAKKIEESLLLLGNFGSCKKLEILANRKGHEILKLFRKLDIEYDDKTGHGKLDGVNINHFL